MTAPQEEFRKILRVLIWGQGLTAGETASRLKVLGYEVTLVDPNNGIQLLSVEGFAGDFRVSFRQSLSPLTQGGEKRVSGKKWTENFGAIVFAPELVSEGNFPADLSAPSSPVITLEEIQKILNPDSDEIQKGGLLTSLSPQDSGREEEIPATLKPTSFVAFAVGLNNEGTVFDMAGTLKAALEIRRRTQSQVSIFCRQVKVAGDGMERLYQSCRDEGILFFKFDREGPVLLKEKERLVIQFEDGILKLPFELAPDLLIVDSRHSLPEEVREGALSAGIGMDKSGFLQPANVHFLPQTSLREGLFIAGPGKGPILPRVCLEEAGATALSVHHFFEGRTSEPMNQEVTVDKGLCTLCLTCLRFCPHQAVGFTHRVFIHPLACRRCGICAGECPMDAIQINGFSDEAVETKLEMILERWDQSESDQSRIIIIGCQRSAGAAWEAIQSSKFEVQNKVEFISLPCAGKLDPAHILKALSLGAEGVMILACPEENCRSVYGNSYARDRIQEAREYLDEAGVNPERIRFENISSNMEWFLKEIIDDFIKQLAVV